MKTPSQNSRRGFTLIELLVAMAITTVIVTVLVSVTAMALETWNRSRAEIRAARQAKSMIDTMARDFESFVSRKGNDFEWLYAKSNPSSDGPKGSASPNAIDLVFFSAATDRYDGKISSATDLGGDVSTVGYQLVYLDPIDRDQNYAGMSEEQKKALKTFVLYRKLVNPDDAFKDILGKTSIKVPFDASGDDIDKENNFICENVYQFTVTFHLAFRDGAITKTVRVPIGQGANSAKNLVLKGTGITNLPEPPALLPTGITTIPGATADQIKSAQITAAEISITVLSDFGMQQMRRRSDLTGAKLAEFIAKHSYQYSKVVQLPGS
jgi:prepilin-type N-terminal cleavage/methylation domain-containing protein